MAPVNLYDMSIAIFLRTFTQLTHILKKAEAHSPTIDPSTASLCTDMLPLTFQIQTCSNSAKGTLTRVAGAENVPMEDNAKTFADLYERIDKTVELLKKVSRKDFEGKDDMEVRFKPGQKEYVMSGTDYVTKFAVPNFMFHAVTAYDILRAKGVAIGKPDWLGEI